MENKSFKKKYEIIPIFKQKQAQTFISVNFPHVCFFMRKRKSFTLNYCEISQKLLVISLDFCFIAKFMSKGFALGFIYILEIQKQEIF